MGDFSGLVVNPIYPNLNAAESAAEWSRYLSGVMDACKPIFSIAPAFKDKLEHLVATFHAQLETKQELDYQLLTVYEENSDPADLLQTCKQLAQLNSGAGNEDSEAAFCDGCNYYVQLKTTSLTMTGVQVKNMLRMSKDFDEFLTTPFERLANAAPHAKPEGLASQPIRADSSNCKFDPIASEKRMEDLLKLKCVDHVFAPSMFMVNKGTEAAKGRVFYKTFDGQDRFAITFKQSASCQSPFLVDLTGMGFY